MAITPRKVELEISVTSSAFGKVEPGGVVKMDGDYWDVIETQPGGRMIDMTKHTETITVGVTLRRQLEHQEATEAAGKDRGGNG
jgi:hypothetical protein